MPTLPRKPLVQDTHERRSPLWTAGRSTPSHASPSATHLLHLSPQLSLSTPGHTVSSHACRDTRAVPKIVDNPMLPSIHRSRVHAYAELRDGPTESRRLPTPLLATLTPPPHYRAYKWQPFPHHTRAAFLRASSPHGRPTRKQHCHMPEQGGGARARRLPAARPPP
ncbi:hypothetical protein E2562_016011 [Oryza meyeriana var. granulata]|uniref:Uncharacterized protein n=1 Tax=Oryza meyeriana var. granulata TaxID=110450 RepID=A0A6G1EKN9_9ORYZ|nr:hypothetical protein E2562_016011 [Oryza meyeriana var. granulata]